MGVINITPDSFYDGGFFNDEGKAIERGLKLASAGADIIDIGGESTRPGSESVSEEEELQKTIPVISGIRKQSDILISIDTTKSNVARAALDAGANIINDISALRFDAQMASIAVKYEAPVILMHMKGTPKTMQVNPEYEDVLSEVKSFLHDRIKIAMDCGIKKEKIIIDPGIGFGKRFEDNIALINNLHVFNELNRPVLVGPSRKSFIGKILDLPPQQRLEGTISTAVLSVIHGAHILRVHDVESIKRAILVAETFINHQILSGNSGKRKERNRRHV